MLLPIIYLLRTVILLLQELRCSIDDKLVVEHIKKGKVYGVSSDSVVISKDIKYIQYMGKLFL
ncbi:MAG: hypothetical protein LBC92_02450 [Rickettsiales bacterium]|nr:hypothetical protein [Rickettsiales bacterium]